MPARTKHSRSHNRGAWHALLLATLTLIINFWAWSLISPLATTYADELSLTPLKISAVLAMPVIVGSLGRIVVGVLADRFGGKQILAFGSLLAIVPVVLLVFAQSFGQLTSVAVLLGISGALFAAGVPFVNAWFAPNKRGLALGLFAMGNAGTAVSGLLTPRLAQYVNRPAAFLVVAGLLLLIALTMLFYGRNAPGWKPAKVSPAYTFAAAIRSGLTWDLAMVYVITFGAFVAFGVYLPVLLKVAYGLSIADSAARAAGFVLVATVARPCGGWLSDHIGGWRVITIVLLLVPALAAYVASQSTLAPDVTVAYLSLAAVLGLGNGAVFAVLGKNAPISLVGSITGFVGALGGLGGFLPPLVLGFSFQKTNSYALALQMLVGCSLAVLFYLCARFALTKRARAS